MTRYRSPRIRGLTLHRPWSWAVSDLDKDIENRNWPPPAWILEEAASPKGFYLAIHAGRTYDSQGADWIGESFGRWPPNVGECPQGIVAVVRLAGCVERSDSRWFVGRYGWQFADKVRLIEPIPCRGAQGLWPLEPALLADVRQAWLIANWTRTEKGGAACGQ